MSAVNALLATGALSCKMLHVSSELRALPPEPWGRRLRRVREDVAGLNLEQATEKMARFQLVSMSTISRLESRTEIPSDPRQLRTAFVLCLICGVDPAELGLAPKDLVAALPGVVRDALVAEFADASIRWYMGELVAA